MNIRRLEAQLAHVLTNAWQRAKAIISALIKKFLSWLRASPRQFYQQHQQLAVLQSAVTQAIDSFTAFVTSTVATARQQAAILGGQVAAALPMPRPWLAGLGSIIAKKIAGIITGLELPGNILPAVVNGMLDKAIDEPGWRAQTVLTTEMWGAYRDARLTSFADEGATGWKWVAHPGACAFCDGMDGSIHSIDEPMDSHPNCRCDMQPLYATMPA